MAKRRRFVTSTRTYDGELEKESVAGGAGLRRTCMSCGEGRASFLNDCLKALGRAGKTSDSFRIMPKKRQQQARNFTDRGSVCGTVTCSDGRPSFKTRALTLSKDRRGRWLCCSRRQIRDGVSWTLMHGHCK